MSPVTDAQNEYGYYKPGQAIAWLIRTAQNAPHNWLGRIVALAIRKLVTTFNNQPVDTEIEGIRLRCYLHDNVSERKYLFLPWLYDYAERIFLAEHLPADGTFIDIGANAGIYTLHACRALGSGGTVIALEPHPDVYHRLLFNIECNRKSSNWPHVITLQSAVGDRDGELGLRLDLSNLGASSLVRDSHVTGTIPVQVTTLAGVLDAHQVRTVDIIKIDIEGAEDLALLPFLTSADTRLLPRFLIIENSEHFWRHDLVGYLLSHGYRQVTRTRMNSIYRLTGEQSV